MNYSHAGNGCSRLVRVYIFFFLQESTNIWILLNIKISHFLRLSLFGKHYLSQYYSGWTRYSCCFCHVYVSPFHLRVEVIREPSDWPLVQRSLSVEAAIFITATRHWVLTLAKNCSRHSTAYGSSFNPHETLWGEHHHYAHVELSAHSLLLSP